MFNYTNITEFCRKIGREDLAEAITESLFHNPGLFYLKCMIERIDYEPENFMHMEGFAWTLLWLGKREEAEKTFRKLLNSCKDKRKKKHIELILKNMEDVEKVAKSVWEEMEREARGG